MLELNPSSNVACQNSDMAELWGTVVHSPSPDLASLQVGNFEYLKNHRAGLHSQLERCQIEEEFAVEDGDSEAQEECQRRARWIRHKFSVLNRGGIMVWDAPGVWENESRTYGGRGTHAERRLSGQER